MKDEELINVLAGVSCFLFWGAVIVAVLSLCR